MVAETEHSREAFIAPSTHYYRTEVTSVTTPVVAPKCRSSDTGVAEKAGHCYLGPLSDARQAEQVFAGLGSAHRLQLEPQQTDGALLALLVPARAAAGLVAEAGGGRVLLALGLGLRLRVMAAAHCSCSEKWVGVLQHNSLRFT